MSDEYQTAISFMRRLIAACVVLALPILALLGRMVRGVVPTTSLSAEELRVNTSCACHLCSSTSLVKISQALGGPLHDPQ